jgi:formylglycine-generating enzyme required for sulfatase activity
MLFEVVFRHRPFAGSNQQEIFDRILGHDPAPVDCGDDEQLNAIQEICVRCLSKRMQDRFPNVASLRGELERWRADYHAGEYQPADQAAPRLPAPRLPTPRGLRSFDAEDADFFLELLPGPHTADGLPESLIFWKARIDGAAHAKSFPVGLLYGPSGCGKSSFVKAGLLPRLDSRVQCIYVEGEVRSTEARVRAKLASTHPDADESASLAEAFAVAREQAKQAGSTTLLVIDQFEQWLSSNWDLGTSDLVDALRQCDGQHLQALLLVRDDFYLSVNRLFLELEVWLEERVNQAVVDLFTVKHAERVVLRFGQGIGKLGSSLRAEDRSFAAALVDLIARNGRVVCVHLSLLMEMVKDLPWEIQSIDGLGDFTRIGQAYLVRTFDLPTAQPAHRANSRLARSVLASLLPVPGAEIRGSAKSAKELLRSISDEFNRDDVERVLRMLDQELRLITPVDPAVPGNESSPVECQLSYQLTHDYLVPSIREWSTQNQRMTRRGRAELYLQESAQLWGQRRDERLLPGYLGWLRLQWLTDRSSWDAVELDFMRSSTRAITRKAVFSLGTALLLIGSFVYFVVSLKRETRHQELLSAVSSLKNAESMLIEDALQNLSDKRFPVDQMRVELTSAWDAADERQRFRLACGLATLGDERVEALIGQILTLSPLELESLLRALSFNRDLALERLQATAAATDTLRVKARIAMVALRLDAPALASEMADVSHRNPEARTVFIEECSRWHGDLRKLGRMVAELNDASLQSALCLAIGSTPADYMALQSNATEEVGRTMANLFTSSSDRAVHSAAGWVLQAWRLAVPQLDRRAQPPLEASWYIDLQGITLLRMKPGSFTPYSNHHSVRLTRGFWLADREVTIGQFTAYAHDTTCPLEWKLEDWRGPETYDRTSDEHPVQMVRWDEAARYCNWLSWKHGFDPCYEWNGSDWECRQDTGGYRLPTEAEWEYACRAGTETPFYFGEDDAFLMDYAVFNARVPSKTGTRLPNGWGLFDMHCNVWEWCNDWYAAYPDQDSIVDPLGPATGNEKVHRGGDCFDAAERCQSSHRYGYNPATPERNIGFRVARSVITER